MFFLIAWLFRGFKLFFGAVVPYNTTIVSGVAVHSAAVFRSLVKENTVLC